MTLSRAQRRYLKELIACPDGGRFAMPAEWDDPTFQALHKRGYVLYFKTSRRFRRVSITEAGRAAYEEKNPGKTDRAPVSDLIAWIKQRGRVTAADLAKASGEDCKAAARRLFTAEKDGLLTRTGGGTGEAFYWSAIN